MTESFTEFFLGKKYKKRPFDSFYVDFGIEDTHFVVNSGLALYLIIFYLTSLLILLFVSILTKSKS